MKRYTNQQQVDADLDKNGNLILEDDVTFTFNVVVLGNISAKDIRARDISARDISAGDISAGDIRAGNISAVDISAWNIAARDISAVDIRAGDITAGDITAGDISAGDIDYHAFCVVYGSIKCKSILGRRRNAFHKALDGKVIIEEVQ